MITNEIKSKKGREKERQRKREGVEKKRRGPFVMYTTGGIDDCNYQIAVLKGH